VNFVTKYHPVTHHHFISICVNKSVKKVPFFHFVCSCVWMETLCVREVWRQDEVTVMSRRHVGGLVLFILSLGSRRRWVVKCTPKVLCCWGKILTKFQLNSKQGWVAEQVWMLGKIRNIRPCRSGSPLPRSSKPQASYDADCAVLAPVVSAELQCF